MSSGRNRFEVNLAENEDIFVRTGSFLRHPDSKLLVPHKARMPFSRISKQMYFMFVVKGQPFSLTTPYGEAHIDAISLSNDEIFVVKMDHVLAFSTSMFFERQWRIDWVSVLTNQLRYTYFRGPGTLYLFGLGEVKVQQLIDDCVDYDQGSVIGWSNQLRVGASTRSSFLSALLAKEDICLDRFVGSGTLVTQASTLRRLPKRFHSGSEGTSWIDYVNAWLGLGI